MNIEKYFLTVIDQVTANPSMRFISIAAAVLLFIGGSILYLKRRKIKPLKGMRWPGISCMLIAAASLVTNVIQYSIFK